MAGVRFSRDAASRIAEATRAHERRQESQDALRPITNVGQWDVLYFGVADAAIAMNNTGTISIYTRNDAGSLVDTTENITARSSFADISAGQLVAIWSMPWGFEVVHWRCP